MEYEAKYEDLLFQLNIEKYYEDDTISLRRAYYQSLGCR
jgi:hypothetical protein